MPLQLVETSDEDSFVSVAQHVADLLNEGQPRTALADTPANRFLNDCTNLVQEQRFSEYVSRLAGQVSAIYSKMPDKEADCCISIVVHAVGRIGDSAAQATAATGLATALAAGDDRPDDRLTALLSLYSVAQQPAAQLSVLLTAARFTAKNVKCRTAFATAVRGKAARWVSQWGLAPDAARELYLTLASAMRGATDRATNKEQLALAAQGLAVPGGDAAALVPHAAAAMAGFLKSPSVFQLDIMESPAAVAASRDASTAELHKLASAVLAGDVPGTKAASTSAALAAAGGASADEVLSKARMIGLLSVCATTTTPDIALDVLRARLDVPTEQVQMWVVRAIGAKLLEGKIDQVRGVLTVGRSTFPAWGSAQWATLRAQLDRLQENVALASSAMAGVRPPAPLASRTAAVAPVAAAAAAAAPARA